MKSLRNFLFLLCFSSLISSCKKDELVVVDDNTAPVDTTVNASVIDNYINKTYIYALGREPDSIEFTAARQTLSAHNVSDADRDAFATTVLAKPEWANHIFDRALATYLNGMDTSDFTFQVAVYQFLLTDSNNAPFFNLLQIEIDRIQHLQQTIADLQTNNATIIDLHKAITDNYFYDQINMGSENFVKSVFLNFLFRSAIQNELTAGKSMVDGNYAVLFGQVGSTKTDFINIFFGSDDYYEGQARDIFKTYLLREPSTQELSSYTIQYLQTGNYKGLQKRIIKTNEFLGI